jgi:hypothetical protein
MKCFVHVLAVALLSLPLPALAQQSAAKDPVSNTVRSLLQRQSHNLIAAAEEMPADKYGFHPTKEQMTFAHLIMHIAESNDFMCAKIPGAPAPAKSDIKETDPKDKLVAALKGSFDYCTTALEKLNDSMLGEPATLWGGRHAPLAAVAIGLTNDWADHYATAANYLRLSGLLPPTAKREHAPPAKKE